MILTHLIAGAGHRDIYVYLLFRTKRYRRLRLGEHIMALRQQNEMIMNVPYENSSRLSLSRCQKSLQFFKFHPNIVPKGSQALTMFRLL